MFDGIATKLFTEKQVEEVRQATRKFALRIDQPEVGSKKIEVMDDKSHASDSASQRDAESSDRMSYQLEIESLFRPDDETAGGPPNNGSEIKLEAARVESTEEKFEEKSNERQPKSDLVRAKPHFWRDKHGFIHVDDSS